MKFGLLDMLGLAASLAFALPVGNYGLMRLLEGQTALGVAMVVVAVAMVVLPQFFFDPARILRGLFAGLLPARVRGDTTDAEATGGGPTGGGPTGDGPTSGAKTSDAADE